MRSIGTWIGAVLVLAAGALVGACVSNGGGAACFPPEEGPSEPSCAGFTPGLICPVGLAAYYSCVCAGSGAAQTWSCAPSGSTSTGGSDTGQTGTSTDDAGAE